MDGRVDKSDENFAAGLDLGLIKILQENGVKNLFPVQKSVIPILLDSIIKYNFISAFT